MTVTQSQRQSVASARTQIEEQRKRLEEAQEKLKQRKRNLPETQSQRALRQKFAGLRGKIKRGDISRVEQQIESQKQQVKQYEKETLEPYEQKVKSAESQIRSYDKRVSALNLAKRFYRDKIPYGFVDDPLVKNYLKEMYTQARLQKQGQIKLLENPELLQQKVDVLQQKGLSESLALRKLGFEKVDSSKTKTSIPKDMGIKSFQLPDSPNRSNQIYNPSLGGFQKYSPLDQGTAIIESPTMQENIKIQQAQYKGSLQNIKSIPTRLKTEFQSIPAVNTTLTKFKNWTESTNEGKIADYFSERKGSKADSIISPASIKRGADWLGGGLLKTGEFISGKVEKVYNKAGVNTSNNFLFQPTGLSKEQAKSILGSALIFGAFSPAMQTATYQQSQYADEVVEVIYKGKRVKMTLSEARALGLQPMTRLQATGEFGRLSEKRQLDILKEAFKGRVYLDQTSLQKDVALAIKFMREAGLTDVQIKLRLASLFPQQQTSTVIQATTLGGTAEKTTQQLGTNIFAQARAQTTQLKQLQLLETGVVLGDTKQQQSLFFDSAQAQKSKQDTKQQTKQTLALLSTLKSGQEILQDTKQDTKQVQLTGLKSWLGNVSKQETRIPRPQQETTNILKATQEPKKPKKPRLPILSKNTLKKVAQKIESDSTFAVFGKRFGKDFQILETGEKQKAEKALKSFLEGTLGRSGKILKDGKALNLGELTQFGFQFRPSKKDRTRIVQKAKFSLGSAQEKREIKYFRKKKSRKKKSKSWLS